MNVTQLIVNGNTYVVIHETPAPDFSILMKRGIVKDGDDVTIQRITQGVDLVAIPIAKPKYDIEVRE